MPAPLGNCPLPTPQKPAPTPQKPAPAPQKPSAPEQKTTSPSTTGPAPEKPSAPPQDKCDINWEEKRKEIGPQDNGKNQPTGPNGDKSSQLLSGLAANFG